MFWYIMMIAMFLVACMTFGAACRMADALENAEADLKKALDGFSKVLDAYEGEHKISGLPYTI